MQYSLAKKLKAAGFPQGKYIDHIDEEFKDERKVEVMESIGYDRNNLPFKIPTLSELILACGGNFQLVERICVHKINQQEWQAIAVKELTPRKREDEEIIGIGYGDTAEEAVAELWLTIQ